MGTVRPKGPLYASIDTFWTPLFDNSSPEQVMDVPPERSSLVSMWRPNAFSLLNAAAPDTLVYVFSTLQKCSLRSSLSHSTGNVRCVISLLLLTCRQVSITGDASHVPASKNHKPQFNNDFWNRFIVLKSGCWTGFSVLSHSYHMLHWELHNL